MGISIDTLRRWDRSGRIRSKRDTANRRLIPSSEVNRILGRPATSKKPAISARNRLAGRVTHVTVEGLIARVEVETSAPGRVVAIITSEAAEQLGLAAGDPVTAVVKATSVVIER